MMITIFLACKFLFNTNIFLILSVFIVTHRYGTKVANEKFVEFFWSNNAIPCINFPLILK